MRKEFDSCRPWRVLRLCLLVLISSIAAPAVARPAWLSPSSGDPGQSETANLGSLDGFFAQPDTSYADSDMPADGSGCSANKALMQDCADLCAQTPDCVAFVYEAPGSIVYDRVPCPGGCWLKSSAAASQAVTGVTSGILKTGPQTATPQLIPPPAPTSACPGCAANQCVLNNRTSTYNCTRCQGNLLVNSFGSCSCPPGMYGTLSNSSEPACTDCLKGSFCPGGIYTTPGTPAKKDCDAGVSPTTAGLTTAGKRARRLTACVNMPGFSFSLDASGNPVATRCAANSYSPGLKKQLSCVSCPQGSSTEGRNGAWTIKSCVVPAGYYLNGNGTVVPCPKGQYRTKGSNDKECVNCPPGTTTAAEASTNVTACSKPLP